ncbi:hypothetical protein PoB_005942000 [Plakobranchus ocellatus]|uniref:Uncharacterized protein n=1 Tax=Plakobranchus ocellatus TaxID=259542 RepID=A0AAV4CLM8_9GAST|nr:hypothetical protein PoB_005942000 [Plakobranchus ocellatus]
MAALTSPASRCRMSDHIQVTSDETRAHDVTNSVLLQVKHGNASAQDTNDNVTSQPMAAEIIDIPTRPSSHTATPSAHDVESPVSSVESEEHKASLSSSPSDSPVFSSENHRVAQHVKEIKRHDREAADAQTSKQKRW